jgi:DNA-binding NtrC family response regulator
MPEPRNQQLSVLVGIPDAGQRAKVTALLRGEGHNVVEAADVHEMGARLDETEQKGFDAIVCAGLLSEKDDPALAARLTRAEKAAALILLPAGGLLSTASRAQRLGASAVLPHADRLLRLRELLAQGGTASGR